MYQQMRFTYWRMLLKNFLGTYSFFSKVQMQMVDQSAHSFAGRNAILLPNTGKDPYPVLEGHVPECDLTLYRCLIIESSKEI